MNINATLDEREKTHGDFHSVAEVAQKIREALRCNSTYFYIMPKAYCEALDMMASKIARIVCGNPHEVDHWRDLAGYAELARRVAEQVNGE